MTAPTANIHKISYRGQNTRRNFGNKASRKRGEAVFLGAFERAYFAKVKRAGIAAGEFPMSGYGVADLAWIAWSPKDTEDFTALSLQQELSKRQLFAFEAKLNDWAGALKQAFRYRYYSDKAIVVLPAENARTAVDHLECFHRMSVGLWTFDRDSDRIREHYTPTRVRAFNPKAKEKAIGLISSKVNLSKFREKLDAGFQ